MGPEIAEVAVRDLGDSPAAGLSSRSSFVVGGVGEHNEDLGCSPFVWKPCPELFPKAGSKPSRQAACLPDPGQLAPVTSVPWPVSPGPRPSGLPASAGIRGGATATARDAGPTLPLRADSEAITQG